MFSHTPAMALFLLHNSVSSQDLSPPKPEHPTATSPWAPHPGGLQELEGWWRQCWGRREIPGPPPPTLPSPAARELACWLWAGALASSGLPTTLRCSHRTPHTPTPAHPAGAWRMSDNIWTQECRSLPSASPKSFSWSRGLSPAEGALRSRETQFLFPTHRNSCRTLGDTYASLGVLSSSPMGQERLGTGCQAPSCSRAPGDPEAQGSRPGVCS